ARAEEVLENLSSGVEFSRIKTVMEMYCRALAGATMKLATTDELIEKNIGWVSTESASTEGSTVYLPTVVDRYKSKEDNFSWFKVVSTHQVGHLEFGSFIFKFDKPSELFEDLRPKLEQLRIMEAAKAKSGEESAGEAPQKKWLTGIQRFFGLFADRKLVLDLYTVVEDGRLDTRVKAEYLGIKKAYERIQNDALAGRSEMREMPAREAMLELLIRLSLHQLKAIPVPKEHAEVAQKVARIGRRVFTNPTATVEDVAEATLRIYALISPIANEEVPPENWDEMDVDAEGSEGYSDPSEMEDLLEQVASGDDMQSRPEDEEAYEPSDDVDFRGDFKPELTQLLEMLRNQGQDGQEAGSEEQQITQEMIQEMLQQSAEMEAGEGEEGEKQQVAGQFAANMLKEAGIKEPQSPEFGQGPFVHVDEDGGELDSDEPQTFVYDEWDFRADDYKPRWCIVRQKTMAEGDPAYYAATLHAYGNLVMQIRRQFEMLVPETFRKVSRLPDGEDIDIDEVIEAMVDIKTGTSPSEKLYWRRNKVQRDVAVVFLLDTSASTAEAIDETRRSVDDWDAPDDPVEYMLWLRARRGEGMRRTYKRIIDLEKEALVLLINALEAIGDIYGIYGFSGYGRENVEFYTIKDIAEQFSDRVKKRIDRISPLHATRMGPAIRHATTKLLNQDARTKLLFLISDGRPQDRGYSREGVEKEYAVHDTRMALDEARRQNVNAFCLTVDKNGHDYLKTMTQDMSYEVLDDIYALPQRLLYLYKRLTM
ncbi:MAG: VWA domain-containing protein, partial [Chloroflexi bacterium]|nr:VWA domain-containing protein [Chloroflexota bacterium]